MGNPAIVPASTAATTLATKRSWFARHKILTGFLGLFVLILLLSRLGGSGTSSTTLATAVPSGPAPTSAPAAAADKAAADKAAADKAAADKAAADKAAAVPGLNTAVVDGKFTFTVTKVECGKPTIGTSSYLTKEAQGQFCLVSMTVKNTGDKAQYLSSSGQKAFNDKGQQYSADGAAAMYLDKSNTFLEQINPGNSVNGIVVFDIPKDAKLAKLELHDSVFSGGVAVAL